MPLECCAGVGVVGRSRGWWGEHRTPGLLSQARCCLAVGTSPCQAGQSGPTFFPSSGACTGAGAKHDMLGLNVRKGLEHLSASQLQNSASQALRMGLKPWLLASQAEEAWKPVAQNKAGEGMPSAPLG